MIFLYMYTEQNICISYYDYYDFYDYYYYYTLNYSLRLIQIYSTS